jgi:hypothetical protein
MARRTAEDQVNRGAEARRVDIRGAWTGVLSVLVPPAAWLLSLGGSYAVEDFTCAAFSSAGAMSPDQALRIVLTVLNAVLFAVTLVAGIMGFLLARRSPRLRGGWVLLFLGSVGALLALIFAYSIVLIGLHPLVLEVCA